MLIRKLALSSVLVLHALPALAEPGAREYRSKPKPITQFELRNQSFELLAVTRRARANTAFHRAYMDDCESMAKVFPGYPQPALLSLDVRVSF